MKRLVAALALLVSLPALAHNLRLVNPAAALDGANAVVSVDVSWDTSWRDSVNWDAAWLFVKYRKDGGAWKHATLDTEDARHGAAQGSAITAVSDGKGVFVYRAATGSGSVSYPGTRLRWNLAADSLANLAGVEFNVYGIEMVYVAEGAFSLSAQESTRLLCEFVSAEGSTTQITSEAALPAGAIRWIADGSGVGTGNQISANGKTYYGSDALSAKYPKGFGAFYAMKYETSQQQYVDFLNTLSRAQQRVRVGVETSGDSPSNVLVMATGAAERTTITAPPAGNGTSEPILFAAGRPDRACNWLIWADGIAYLDWAGLRPFSELEFDKACRGPLPAVTDELAWGNSTAIAALVIGGDETGAETVSSPANANSVWGSQTFTGGDGGKGPLRGGIFATGTSDRVAAGASYWGIMELSGNVWERLVTVAAQDSSGTVTNAGLFDRDRHGDGVLGDDGQANVATWPGPNALGSNYRGGNWTRPDDWARVGDRQFGGSTIPDRTSHRGIRGARTSPRFSGTGTGVDPAKYHGGAYDGYARAYVAPTLGNVWLLPSSARVAGANGARYTTDLTIANTSAAAASYTVKFLGHDEDGRAGVEASFLLAPGASVTYKDVLENLFSLNETYGALLVSSSTDIAVEASTSTPGAGGRFGQSAPAAGPTSLITAGIPRTLLSIDENADTRTNLVLANATPRTLAVDVTLLGTSGATLATRRYTLRPYEMTQRNRVVRELGVSQDVSGVRLLLVTPTEGGAFAANAYVIDNGTNDPKAIVPQ